MNQLKVVSQNGQLVTDSREVAEMTEKRHDHLMRDIDGYKTVLDQTPDLGADDFFIQSSYVSGTGKTYKRYLLTKIGCDMVANKMTGQKGVLFTAVYTKKFEQMEQQLQEQNKPSYMIDDPVKRAEKWIAERKERDSLEQENAELKPKASYHDLVMQSKSLLSVTAIAKDYGMGAQTLNKILKELGVQYKQGGRWFVYHKYQDKGYTQSKTHTIDAEKSNTHMYWTQKGRLFIYNLLREQKGILPTVERENEQLRLVK